MKLISQSEFLSSMKMMLLVYVFFFFLATNLENEGFKKVFLKITKYISTFVESESVHPSLFHSQDGHKLKIFKGKNGR